MIFSLISTFIFRLHWCTKYSKSPVLQSGMERMELLPRLTEFPSVFSHWPSLAPITISLRVAGKMLKVMSSPVLQSDNLTTSGCRHSPMCQALLSSEQCPQIITKVQIDHRQNHQEHWTPQLCLSLIIMTNECMSLIIVTNIKQTNLAILRLRLNYSTWCDLIEITPNFDI